VSVRPGRGDEVQAGSQGALSDIVRLVTHEEYDAALAAVTDAARVYHGGVSDRVAGENTDTVWSPIYADLLAELATRLRIAGMRYDKAADEMRIMDGERFDWRTVLDGH
jgi:hypothetical protein